MGNIKLLKDTRDMIVMFPEKHDQKTWICDTSMCIAGHASVLAGAKIKTEFGAHYFTDPDGLEISASGFADDALDLSNEEYEYLFFCMDNEVAVKRIDHVISLWEEGKILEEDMDNYISYDGEDREED